MKSHSPESLRMSLTSPAWIMSSAPGAYATCKVGCCVRTQTTIKRIFDRKVSARLPDAYPNPFCTRENAHTLKSFSIVDGACQARCLRSEGKGQKFESSRARHDFNELAGLANEPLVAAEATRKHPARNIWTDCRALVAPGAWSPRSPTGLPCLNERDQLAYA
jgi:hypothetical protein